MKDRSLEKLRIGYAGYSRDFSVPGDRRRFAAYAKHKNLNYEYADPEREYDLVFITYNTDLGKWIDYKKKRGNKCILIFELVDSYMAEDPTWKTALRGTINYVTGRNSKLYFDYRKCIAEICSIADVVVCSTEEQKKTFQKYNSNVHISLDIFSGDIKCVKNNFAGHDKLKIVWEGQPHTLHNILEITDVFNELSDQIELHIVTDKQYFKYSNKYLKKNTEDLLSAVKCKKIFYPWEKHTFSEIITQSDLAVIPIKMEEKLSLGKPENKLILLWQMGIPALVSPTPAYTHVINNAGVDLLCYSKQDWKNKIINYQSFSSEDREKLSNKVKNFAMTNYSAEKLYQKWEEIFSSIL